MDEFLFKFGKVKSADRESQRSIKADSPRPQSLQFFALNVETVSPPTRATE
jgi:hypothetical protein